MFVKGEEFKEPRQLFTIFTIAGLFRDWGSAGLLRTLRFASSRLFRLSVITVLHPEWVTLQLAPLQSTQPCTFSLISQTFTPNFRAALFHDCRSRLLTATGVEMVQPFEAAAGSPGCRFAGNYWRHRRSRSFHRPNRNWQPRCCHFWCSQIRGLTNILFSQTRRRNHPREPVAGGRNTLSHLQLSAKLRKGPLFFII